MSEITYPLSATAYSPNTGAVSYVINVLSGPQVGEEGEWVVKIDTNISVLGPRFRVYMRYFGESDWYSTSYSAWPSGLTQYDTFDNLTVPAAAGWKAIEVEGKRFGDYYRPSTDDGGGIDSGTTPGTGGGGDGGTGGSGTTTNDGGFTNTGDTGDIAAFQSGIRQRFVRLGNGLALTEGSTTTEPGYAPIVTTEHEAFSTVDRKQWETFLAEREHYSENFGTTVAFTSSTPGATYPDSVGAYPMTWYPLTYSVNVAAPTVGVAGTVTLTVNVLQDLQEYRRLKKKLGGPVDNPFMVDRTEEDGFPINSAVYPHVVRCYYQVFASNPAKSASFGGTQAETDRIQIPMLVEYPVTVYPYSFSFDVPENWWGIEITNGGNEGNTYDPENGYPSTPGKNGSDNYVGVTESHFMGVAPKFKYTETTGGEYTGDKTVTTGGSFDPFGDTGDVVAFQSVFAQQFVREGGMLDLSTGASSDASSSSSDESSGSDGGSSSYPPRSFTYNGKTLTIGAGPVSVRSSGFSIPSWIWSVSYMADPDSQWRVVIESDGEYEDAFDIPSNGTKKTYADGTFHNDVWDFATYGTSPIWYVINLNEGNGTRIADDTGQTSFGYTPVTGD